MKRTTGLIVAVMALAISVYAKDSNKDSDKTTMQGWICNSSCVTQGSGHAACDQNCDHKSGELVLIDDRGRILKIINQDKVKSYAGKQVKMKCRPRGDDAMFVDTVSLYGGGG
ncbi:MAG TPA: hypothetical protein VKW06_15540 [Candidatus Angelobacter sp.]|nr:hypothetical protein [Candidatus Angelobacter sp.]